MGDSEDKPASAGIPAWQQRSEQDGQLQDRLELARRFLDDDEVKTASRGKKAEFLKTKGVEDGDIQKLLGQSETVPEPHEVRLAPHVSVLTSPKKHHEEPNNDETPTQRDATQTSALPAAGGDRAPIVTYPEFLAKPQRPPPLVTTDGLLATLYGFVGLSTLLCGTSKFVVAPMVESLTDARSDLYGTSSQKLDILVAKLEKTVSEIPPSSKAQPATTDDISDAEDPTEMFHRDIGTQTSLPTTPAAVAPSKPASAESESKRQADRLSTLTKTLSGLKDQFRTQSEDMDDIRTLLDVFRDDLDGMTYGGQTQFMGGYDMYGGAKKTEPEDEIRKVRDNIRRVKGVLLSTRSFPASAR
ncbi:Uncharacterized protein TCAP_07047 [Tolypocladium capitatum]|uniref:Peroxisomal membrane protein PEX14 n=1 Tax=Tolypocladium capitatum TaxID=45235 RepID=A0A2K3Q5W3_9HYPO|nr:Uncharacterized protein TCAP_07047 [Tolypocladium capitatum]